MDTATAMDSATALAPGLDHPVFDSIKVFRAIADAMSHPGEIKRIPARPPAPAQLMPAAAALCLTLLDFETPLWLQSPQPAVADYLRFHCGCSPALAPEDAAFALITNTVAMPTLSAFNAGVPEYPDRSTTLLMQVASLSNASGVRLSGPGLRQTLRLDVAGVPAHYWREVQDSRAAFPCGVDIVFICNDRIAALPRTTVVEL
jgi:alpha-D-ribose 1-methylphosphonate 5-triphosphate synthase subunit PhnH